MKKIIIFLFMISSLVASPKAIVFDFNGVITKEPFNKEMIYPFLHETVHLSRDEFERVCEEILTGRTDQDYWRSLTKEKGVTLDNNWGKRFKAIMTDAFVRPEMFDLINRIKQKQIQVVLFSNMDKDPAKRFREAGLFEPFDLHIFAYEIGSSKPDPKAYQILLKQLDLLPQDVIFIDDQIENIEAAAALGIDAIHFQSPNQLQEELQKKIDL